MINGRPLGAVQRIGGGNYPGSPSRDATSRMAFRGMNNQMMGVAPRQEARRLKPSEWLAEQRKLAEAQEEQSAPQERLEPSRAKAPAAPQSQDEWLAQTRAANAANRAAWKAADEGQARQMQPYQQAPDGATVTPLVMSEEEAQRAWMAKQNAAFENA